MKKTLSKKFFALILFLFLLPIAYCLFTTPTHAQDVELLPNASPSDYQVETAPYREQEYEVRTASFATRAVQNWIIRYTLGKVVNSGLGLVGESLAKWIPDVMHFGVVSLTALLNGKEGLHGGGWCTPTKNNCWDDPETTNFVEYVPEVVGDYCRCVRNPNELITYNPSDHGMVGVMGTLTSSTLQQGPPNMHTAQFVKRELANNIFSSTAYAKTGKEYFEPVVVIWRIVRNISYVLMVLILVGMGFMVMLRSKIDPRTTMTVSAALPRIAFSLILIAFSYPIAGIIVDIGRLSKGLIDAAFGSIMPLHTVEPFRIIVDSFGNFVAVNIFNPLSWLGGWGNINLGGTGIFALAIQCGMSIIALVIAFMLFFTLVFRFAGLFMQVVFAPLVFAWGALPGQEETTGKWFKSFAVNVLCFPAIYFIVNLSNLIANVSLTPAGRMSLPTDLGWGTINPSVQTNVGGLIAFGLLVTATKIPALLEDAFDVAPSGGAARAGVDVGKTLGRLPIVGKIVK